MKRAPDTVIMLGTEVSAAFLKEFSQVMVGISAQHSHECTLINRTGSPLRVTECYNTTRT